MNSKNSNPRLADTLSLLKATERCGVLTGTRDRITEANDAFLKMVGYSREEMASGRIDWRTITPPEFLAVAERGLQEVRERGACVPFEHEYVLRDGTRLPILVGAVRLKEEPLEWLCWILDLTARNEVAAAQQNSALLRNELDAELAGAYWIYEISSRLIGKSSISEVLNEILDAAIALTEADFGNIQLLDGGVLRIVAQRNFPQEFLDFFRDVTDDTPAACSAALQCRSRVVIENVETDSLFRDTSARDVLLNSGIRGVQSTPMFGNSGELYGMISTQFRKVGRPTERSLRYLDLLAGRAGQVLEKLQYAEIERRTERFMAAAELANALAHEINNPLQALTNVNALLAAQANLPKEAQDIVRIATEELAKVNEIAKRLLTVEFRSVAPRSPNLVKLIDHMREESGLTHTKENHLAE